MLFFTGKSAEIIDQGISYYFGTGFMNSKVFESKSKYHSAVYRVPVLGVLQGLIRGTEVNGAKRALHDEVVEYKSKAYWEALAKGIEDAWKRVYGEVDSNCKVYVKAFRVRYLSVCSPFEFGYELTSSMLYSACHIRDLQKQNQISFKDLEISFVARLKSLYGKYAKQFRYGRVYSFQSTPLNIALQAFFTYTLEIIRDPIYFLKTVVDTSLRQFLLCCIDQALSSTNKRICSSFYGQFFKKVLYAIFLPIDIAFGLASYLFTCVSDIFFIALPGRIEVFYPYQMGKSLGMIAGLTLTIGAAVGKISLVQPLLAAVVGFISAGGVLPPLVALIIASVLMTYVCALAGILIHATGKLTYDAAQKRSFSGFFDAIPKELETSGSNNFCFDYFSH